MKNINNLSRTPLGLILPIILVSGLAIPLPAQSGTVALATSPLTTSTSTSVKPNLMFILDDSTSMSWDYLPDWADDTAPSSDSSNLNSGRKYSDVPALFRNNSFNGVAYNPAITYSPPVHYNTDGTLNTTTYPSFGSPWTAVKNDGYNIQSTTSINLTTSVPDIEWCTDTNYTTCLRNDNLLLPGVVGGFNYSRTHSKNSTGTGSVATGNPDAPTAAARTFGPFFYTIVPGEYCDSASLTNCQNTETATFKYPAPLRWCNSTARTTCRAIQDGSYKYPRYPTLVMTPATAAQPAQDAQPEVAAVAGVAASASFTFNYAGSLNPVGLSIKVDGTEMLTATTPDALLTSTQLAGWVSSHFSLAGYNISFSGSTVTVTASTTGTAKNISSVVITEAPGFASNSTNPSVTSGADAVTGVRPTGLITFGPAGTTRNGGTPRINDNLSGGGSHTIRVGSTNVYSNDIDPGRNKTATQVAASVVAAVGTDGNIKAYIGGNAITPTCAAQPSNVVCLVVTNNYTNGSAVLIGSRSDFNTLVNVTTTATAGGVTPVNASYASGTINFTYAGLLNPTGMSLLVDGTEVLSATTPGALTANTAMDAWIDANSSLTGYNITSSGSTVTFTATATGPAWNLSSITYSQNASTPVTYTAPVYIAGVDAVAYQPATEATPEIPAQPAQYYGRFIRTDIVSGNDSYPYPGSTTKASTRTDCVADTTDPKTCTYAEEMTNYANWWAYYRTRMQAMKTSVSRSFKSLDNNFRVGFNTISNTGASGTKFLGNDAFELTHKNSWFTKLFATIPPTSTINYTPLRGALSLAGKYYAKKISGQVDPVQYSCQQNFTILSTDGYWNTNDETSTYKNLGVTNNVIGDMDGSAARPMYDSTPASGTLADIAKYYYDTDLRTSSFSNCSGGISTDFPSGNTDVCLNNVFTSTTDNNIQQHMTTFTMGLGIDGTLNYQSDYLTATSGDYYDLKNGLGSPTKNWPDPINNSLGERIDDLWHAAVNGRGTYFSAKDPNSIIQGLNKALSAITAKLGSAAAAATSTLNPVSGNNNAYVASYTTVKWTGNLEARTINVTTGSVSRSATWCLENIVGQSCASPGTIQIDSSGSSTIYNCVVAPTTAAACAGTFDSSTNTCTTQLQNSCTGTMQSMVGANTDTRTIYTVNDDGDALVAFDAAYATAKPAYFSSPHINALNQWGDISTKHTPTKLVNYLRGQTGYEERASNDEINQLYRMREAVVGDALESQPFYSAKPAFRYPYPGYQAYKSANLSRAGSVFMGSNSGMMHSFNASNGSERWAYIPSMVLPNLYKLASTSYSTHHANYVNGSANIADVCTANCGVEGSAVWKTILVAGLNAGGRGYFALDVTDPATPVLLWEFTTPSADPAISHAAEDNDIGYAYAQPVITRKQNGTWVALVTSGYNNVSPGDGKGYLYVLNAYTGAIISKIATNEGSTTTPSGLNKIAAWNDEPIGNLASYTYGGDLQGNLWRFDINDTDSAAIGTGSVLKFAKLYSDIAGTTPQPITTSPVLAEINGMRQILISTGQYLEINDQNTTQKQTLYSIRDDNAVATLDNPRNHLIQQTLTNSGQTSTRTSSHNTVSYSTQRGCFADYPDVGERANIDSTLIRGTLIAPTIVPKATACSPGGYGWVNYFDYKTCGAVENKATAEAGDYNNAGVKMDTSIVGVNVIFIDPDGADGSGDDDGENAPAEPIVKIVTASDPTPEDPPGSPPEFSSASSAFQGRRTIWRELIP